MLSRMIRALVVQGIAYTILAQLPPMHLNCIFVTLNTFHDSCNRLVDFQLQIEQEKSRSEKMVISKPKVSNGLSYA